MQPNGLLREWVPVPPADRSPAASDSPEVIRLSCLRKIVFPTKTFAKTLPVASLRRRRSASRLSVLPRVVQAQRSRDATRHRYAFARGQALRLFKVWRKVSVGESFASTRTTSRGSRRLLRVSRLQGENRANERIQKTFGRPQQQIGKSAFSISKFLKSLFSISGSTKKRHEHF